MPDHSELGREETDAILAGLRLLQLHLERGTVAAEIDPIFSGGNSHAGLDSDSLDELCERINCGSVLLGAGRQSPPEIPEAQLTPRIEATAWPDGRPFTVDFQANHFFSHADEQDLIALAFDADWSCDYAADWVAEFTAAFDSQVNRVFEYLSVTGRGGFECSVDGDQAMVWLKAHRPGVWAQILCQLHGVRIVQAEEDEIRGRWDWIDDSRGEGSDSSLDTAGAAALDALRALGLDEAAQVA